MNIHFSQVDRKNHLLPYLLAAFAVLTVLMLALNMSRHTELSWSSPSTSGQAVQPIDSHLPTAIPAPLPPAEQAGTIATPAPAGDMTPVSVPQVIPAPLPSVP